MNIKYFFSGIFLLFLFVCHAETKTIRSLIRKPGQISTAPIDTSKLLMTENEFWKIIDQSRKAAGNKYEQQTGELKNILLGLTAENIEKFDNRFTALMALSYDSKLWGAAYVISGGCSDDCFEYFRQYLIGHGKEKFYQALKAPDNCAGWIKSEDEENWEGLQYAAAEAYLQKTGKQLPKTFQPELKLKGKPFDEETVFKQYPKLVKKFIEE